MKRLKATTLILVGVAFCLALLGGLRWSAQPMFRPPQGLHSDSEADLVRARYPHRLVDPSELNVADDKVSGAWVGAEIKARLKTVSIFLGICGGVAIIVAYLIGIKTAANQQIQSIAGKPGSGLGDR